MRIARLFSVLVVAIIVAVLQGAPTSEVAHAAFLGGNGKLLVSLSNVQLASVELDGTDFRILGAGTNGSWSPDGRRIAFNTVPTGDISIMDADGSNIVPIFVGPTYDVLPTWSPDGERIVFSSGRGGAGMEIYTAKADGSGVVQLTDVGTIRIEGNDPPKWSPDGTRILFIGQEPAAGAGTSWDLYTVPAAGGGLTRLTNTGAKEHAPEWSPDGSKIAFVDDLADGIMVMNAGGGGATLVAGGALLELYARPVWSPDGARIAYTEMTSPPGIPPVTFASYVMDPTGGNKTALPVSGTILDWQPVPNTKVEFTQAIQVLQSIDELKDDLKGDGAPPVPIVAGKPAVMRVLFDEVDAATTYTVEVSGEFNGSETATLNPGCDTDQRRKQLNNCKSVDFYFTPPQGNWSVTLEVKDAGGGVLEHREFNLTSEKSDAIVLKAVDVCHAKSTLVGPWTCQSAASLVALASHLRKVVPTDDVSVVLGGHQVRRRVSDYADPDDWMSDVVGDIDDLFTAIDASVAGQDVYYFGLSDPLAGGYNGIAEGAPGHGGLSRALTTALGQTTTHTTIAHEVGHLMGLDHTGVNQPTGATAPGCWGAGGDPAGWPFLDNNLYAPQDPQRADTVEVGFDVASQTALPGDAYFELISYCAPRWVSAHSYVKFLGPTGPLRKASVVASAPLTGPFWLVAGEIAGGAAEFKPLVEIDTEGPAGAGSGAYRVEVRDGAGSVQLTRSFTPRERHPEAGPGQVESEAPPVFSELIPVQAGAAAIVVLDDQDAELGRITLGGVAPNVSVTLPASFTGVQTVSWLVTDPDSAQRTSWVDYSPDNGQTWQNLAMSLAEDSLALDFDGLAGSSGSSLFRVIASDGVNSKAAVSAPFSVAGKPPHGEIIGPSGGSAREGSLVWLEAAAWDTDDGTLDDGDVTWSSSRDGALGTGASLPVYDLSVGTHTITMTAKDSDENAVTDTITVVVYDGPIIEGQVGIAGDVDCSGAVNSVDALKLSRQVAGLPVAQTQPCPDVGTGDPLVFGDINCDGNITAVDTLFVLRFVAGMPVNLPQGCRQVGT